MREQSESNGCLLRAFQDAPSGGWPPLRGSEHSVTASAASNSPSPNDTREDSQRELSASKRLMQVSLVRPTTSRVLEPVRFANTITLIHPSQVFA